MSKVKCKNCNDTGVIEVNYRECYKVEKCGCGHKPPQPSFKEEAREVLGKFGETIGMEEALSQLEALHNNHKEMK